MSAAPPPRAGTLAATDRALPPRAERVLTAHERDQLRDACHADPTVTTVELARRWGCPPDVIAGAIGHR